VLYAEFDESARFYEGKMALTRTFANAEDLLRQTPEFWTHYVLSKINNEFWGLYRFLNQPYPDGPNRYLQLVEANIDRIRQRLVAVA